AAQTVIALMPAHLPIAHDMGVRAVPIGAGGTGSRLAHRVSPPTLPPASHMPVPSLPKIDTGGAFGFDSHRPGNPRPLETKDAGLESLILHSPPVSKMMSGVVIGAANGTLPSEVILRHCPFAKVRQCPEEAKNRAFPQRHVRARSPTVARVVVTIVVSDLGKQNSDFPRHLAE